MFWADLGTDELFNHTGYEETEPELVQTRERDIIVVCRSGYRSTLTAFHMQLLGFKKVYSLATGLKGYNDYELPFVDIEEKPVATHTADLFFANKILPHQLPLYGSAKQHKTWSTFTAY